MAYILQIGAEIYEDELEIELWQEVMNGGELMVQSLL